MRLKKFKWKTLILAIALVAAVFFTTACSSAEVKINRDGSGTATVTIAASENVTEESVRAKIDEIFAGVGTVSGDDYRLKLKSFKKSSEGFRAVISFKRIQYTDGLGNFNYLDSKDFLKELNKTSLIKNKWAEGRYDSFQNYTQNLYNFRNSAVGDPALAFKPIDLETKKELDPAEFVAQDGALDAKKGKMFTYFIADIEGLESITFSFDGKIKAYGGKNVEVINSSTIKVYPVTAKANITVASTAETVAGVDVDCFAGYVFFTLNANRVAMGIWIAVGIIIAGFVIFGICSGLFKRIFRGKVIKSMLKNYDLYLMMLPALALLILFSYLPMGGVVLAFKNYRIDDGIWGSEWAAFGGFKNFYDLFTNPAADFALLIKNTFVLAILKFIFGFVCAILLAVLFSYLRNGIFKKVVQTISYFPYFISWVVVSGIAYLFLATEGGILNQMFSKLGLAPVRWYSSPQYWYAILTFTSIWKTVGYSTIVYLAAITAINPALYEAATIDGGGRWKQLIHITVPGMFTVIGIQVVFSLGNLVKDDFDQIYTMIGGNNASLHSTTEVIGTVVYKSIGKASSYSSASAMGLIQGLVSLVIVLISNKVVKKLGMEGVF